MPRDRLERPYRGTVSGGEREGSPRLFTLPGEEPQLAPVQPSLLTMQLPPGLAWAREITGLQSDASTFYHYEGPWLAPPARLWPGSVVVCKRIRMRSGQDLPEVAIYVPLAEGLWFVAAGWVPQVGGWARQLSRPVRLMLSVSPLLRVTAAGNEAVSMLWEASTVDPDNQEQYLRAIATYEEAAASVGAILVTPGALRGRLTVGRLFFDLLEAYTAIEESVLQRTGDTPPVAVTRAWPEDFRLPQIAPAQRQQRQQRAGNRRRQGRTNRSASRQPTANQRVAKPVHQAPYERRPRKIRIREQE